MFLNYIIIINITIPMYDDEKTMRATRAFERGGRENFQPSEDFDFSRGATNKQEEQKIFSYLELFYILARY